MKIIQIENWWMNNVHTLSPTSSIQFGDDEQTRSGVIHCSNRGAAAADLPTGGPFATSALKNSESAPSGGQFISLQLSADQARRRRGAALATVWRRRASRRRAQKQSPELQREQKSTGCEDVWLHRLSHRNSGKAKQSTQSLLCGLTARWRYRSLEHTRTQSIKTQPDADWESRQPKEVDK